MSKFNFLLANYLNEIEHELRDLPANARENEMREIKAHLRALIQVEQQPQEASEIDATAIALRQFGEPRAIGRKLRRAWERGQSEAWWRAGLALAFALGFYAISAFPLMQEFFNFYLDFHGVDATIPADDANARTIYQILAVYSQFLGFFFMLFETYVMGLISPKRSKWVIATILVCMIIPMTFGAYPNVSSHVLILSVNLMAAATIGTYGGVRHGRRLLARSAKAR